MSFQDTWIDLAHLAESEQFLHVQAEDILMPWGKPKCVMEVSGVLAEVTYLSQKVLASSRVMLWAYRSFGGVLMGAEVKNCWERRCVGGRAVQGFLWIQFDCTLLGCRSNDKV